MFFGYIVCSNFVSKFRIFREIALHFMEAPLPPPPPPPHHPKNDQEIANSELIFLPPLNMIVREP